MQQNIWFYLSIHENEFTSPPEVHSQWPSLEPLIHTLADECHNWPRAVPGRRSRRLRRRFALVERSEQKLWARDKTIRALPGAEFSAILKP